MPVLQGGDKLQAALASIASNLKGRGTLRVGFLQNAQYPDGTSVALIASIQEFGAPRAGIPPRPFFRTMIARESAGWSALISGQLKKTNYDLPLTLGRVGEVIKGQLQQSIRDLTEPPLSPVTLMVRQIIGPNGRATMADVLEARRRVKAGESAQGVSSKPLVWSGHMIQSVGVEVET